MTSFECQSNYKERPCCSLWAVMVRLRSIAINDILIFSRQSMECVRTTNRPIFTLWLRRISIKTYSSFTTRLLSNGKFCSEMFEHISRYFFYFYPSFFHFLSAIFRNIKYKIVGTYSTILNIWISASYNLWSVKLHIMLFLITIMRLTTFIL